MKKFLSILLTVLVLGFVAAPVSAQTVWDGTADITWYDASQTSFDISTPEQLAGVASLVNSGTSFSGMTLNLVADIWLNSTGDSTNNWVPIGGNATATSEDQYAGNAFQGAFNGHGHSIYNLYCEKTNYFHAGLFGCIKNPCTIDSLVMVNPTVKSCGMMGAIAGMSRSGGAIYIRYCLVINANIVGTPQNAAGSPSPEHNNIAGILGANYPNSSGTYIQNCGVTGSISGRYIGGIGGNAEHDYITNCYFAGTLTPYNTNYGGMTAHGGDRTNCYSYTVVNGSQSQSSASYDGTSVTQAEMQDPQMIVNLGDAFKMDNGINNGYPVMSYMAGVDPLSAEICQGESVTLTAFGFDSYVWSNGSTSDAITVSPTSTTNYTVTCTANGTPTVYTIPVTVFPQAVVTASVVASADGQTHATLNQSSFTVGCGSSDNITLVVTPETNWRVSRVTLNGNEIYGDTFGEGAVTVTVNPGGTLGEIKVFLSNEYTISILELLDTGDTLHVSSLVQPYGSNGVVTVTAGNDQTFAFNNTARYVLQDAEIDGVSQGAVTSYDFTNIHENHSIVVTYVDSCGIFVLPFFEDFESVSSGIPECYEKNTGNSSYPTVNNYYPYQGNSIYVYNYSYGESANEVPCLIMPKIDEQFYISELMVQFYGRASSDAGLFVVGVMTDPADMSTFTTVQVVSPTNTSGAYEHYTAYLGSYQGTGQYIAIKFPVTAYCLLGIDNLTVDYAPMCSPITNLAATDVYGSNATLTWDPTTVGEVSEYNIVITDNVTGNEDYQTTTETTYLLTGLNELTSYTVGVYTSCTNGQTSDTTFVSFTTPCNNPVNYSVGNATTTNNYLPTQIYYGNTYTQQIVTADVFEGTPNDFASLSVKDNSTSATTRACDIYLAHVPASMNLANDWILPSNSTVTFTQVFSGNVQFGTGDWVKIDFDTVFPYNGTDNLLVVFSDHTNSYTSSHSFDVVSNSNTSSMARYAYRDGTPYDVFNPGVSGTALSVVNTFRFSYCDASSCISPNTLSASNLTENSADIAWVSAGSESSWEVEYKASTDADWTSDGTVFTTSTTLYGLNGNTLYSVRVRALCSGNEQSPWSESISFRTECASITQLPYSEDFEDATALYNSGAQENYIVCWDRYASNASHYVYIPSNTYAHSGTHFLDFHHTSGCFNIAIMPAVDQSINVSDLMVSFYACRSGSTGYLEVGVMTDKTDPTTFVVMDTIDLSSYNTYEYGLQQVSFENYMDNGQYVAFRVSNGVSCGFYIDDVLLEERPNCMYPTNLHSTNVSNDEITLAWTETGSATDWNILYGLTGFDPEIEGTTVPADSNPYTVTGLQNATSYDFYVQADCGGLQSQWTGPITVKTGVYNMGVTGSDTLTTCGVYIYDDGGESSNHSTSCDYTLVVYPATAGSGLSLSGSVNLYNGSSYYQGTLTIYEGVGTSGNVLGTFTGTQTVNLACGGPVTLHFTSGSYYNYAGFEILVQCTECFPPSNLAVSGQTLDGATVSWSGNADSYAVYLSGAMTGYYTTTDTSYTFTGLTSSSSYNVQVRALCSGDSSLLSSTAHFNTACGAITITADDPWFEDFEGYSGGGGAHTFVCWETPVTEVVDNGTSPFVYCGHAPSCHSGANSAELKGTNNMLVLPEFSNDIQDLRLEFWATTTSTTNYGTVEVGYITDINDPTTFVALGPAGVPGPRGSGSSSGNGNYMGPFDFNSVTATSARMAIKFTGYSGLSWNLDDFTVSLAPGCPSPVKTSVQASNIDGHNATISFTDNDPDHNSWTVYYKPSADSVWDQVVTTTTTTTLTNLDPQTQYDVYVVTNCTTPDATEDQTLTIHFTTTVACPAPQSITVAPSTNDAVVTWFGTADSYTVTCGENTVTVTETTVTLTGLNPATTYTVSITADCGVEGTSSAGTATFMTACDVISTFPYNEGFESGQLGCWSQETVTGNNPWAINSYAANTGTYCVQMNYTVNTSSHLYTPIFDLTSLTNPMMSFYYQSESFYGSLDTFAIYYRTSNNDAWVRIAGFDQEAANYVMDSVALPNPSATYQIAFFGYGSDGYGIYLDDIQIYDGSGSGPVVTDPTVTTGQATAIAQTTATLNASITNPSNVTITAKGFEWKTTMGGTFTQIAGTGTGNSFTANLSNLTANTGYTFKAFITYNGTTVYGNEVTFTTLAQGQLQEPTATTLPATSVTQTTATLNGTIANPDNVTITAQGFEWKQVSASNYTVVNATGATMTSPLTGLTANTGYIYRAFVTTANGTHYGADVTFTTLEEQVEPCDAPTGLDTTAVANETISITWNANSNVNSWNIQYRPQNGTWTSASSNTNSYTITGLTGNTVYEIQVQAVCADGQTSDWSASLFVTTKSVGINSWLDNSVSLYPNPAKEYVDIRVDGDLNVTMMEVYDVYGKLINTVNVIDNPTRINVATLADGMYFVRVTTEKGAVTKTFVKK